MRLKNDFLKVFMAFLKLFSKKVINCFFIGRPVLMSI